MNQGFCSITRAELRGSVEELTRAWDAGFRKVILQLDSKVAIALMSNSTETAHQHGMEVIQFRSMLRRDWTVKFIHFFREANFLVDYLTNKGYDLTLGIHTIDTTNRGVLCWAHYDLFRGL
ncbi:Putative ribonuclease H protein At1g65750 [Linum perenne]